MQKTKEFWNENEAKRANKHANKRIIYCHHFGIRCIAFEDFRCCTQQSVTKMTKAANTETIMTIKYQLSSAFSRCVVAKENVMSNVSNWSLSLLYSVGLRQVKIVFFMPDVICSWNERKLKDQNRVASKYGSLHVLTSMRRGCIRSWRRI